MQIRPAFQPPAGVAADLAARMAEAAAQKWCFVTGDGRSFFVDEARASRLLDRDPDGTVFPPKPTVRSMLSASLLLNEEG